MRDSHMSRSKNFGIALHNSSSNPSRRQRRSADIRERLFGAALQLFAQKGFAETTVEDITEAADVGKGTFFNYFPSKDHILGVRRNATQQAGSGHRNGSPIGRAHARVSPFARYPHDPGAHSQPRHHPGASPSLSFNNSGSRGDDGPAKAHPYSTHPDDSARSGPRRNPQRPSGRGDRT